MAQKFLCHRQIKVKVGWSNVKEKIPGASTLSSLARSMNILLLFPSIATNPPLCDRSLKHGSISLFVVKF